MLQHVPANRVIPAPPTALAADTPLAVACAPGDGAGPEIMEATLRVVQVLAPDIDFVEVDLRGARQHGFRPEALSEIRRIGLLLQGPLASDETELDRRLGLSVLAVRGAQAPWLAAEARPSDVLALATLDAGEDAPEERRDADGAVVRLRRFPRERLGAAAQRAIAIALAEGRSRICFASRAQALPMTDGLALKIFRDAVAAERGLTLEALPVEFVVDQLLTDPVGFDAIVAPAPYGELLASMIAAASGAANLTPSAAYGPAMAVFRPARTPVGLSRGVHEPNPAGLILSAAMMLRHTSREEAADVMRRACLRALFDGVRTSGIANTPGARRIVSARGFAQAVIARLGEAYPGRGAAAPRDRL